LKEGINKEWFDAPRLAQHVQNALSLKKADPRVLGLNDRRRVAASQLILPAIGQGCGTLGDPDVVISEHQAQQTLETAWEGGIRYFDTAPWYGNTKSEHRVGYFLRQKKREDFLVTTKVGRVYRRPEKPETFGSSPWMARWCGGLPFDLRFDYTRDGILRSYEDSLMRLGLNSIDALVIHDLDFKHQKTEENVLAALDDLSRRGGYQVLRDLKDRGEIKAIGVGINHTGMIKLFLERFDIDYFLVAMPYTLLDQPALDEDFLLCAERGSHVVIGAVYSSGILATGARGDGSYAYQRVPQDVLERVQRIEAVCGRHNVLLRSAAIQFPLAHPIVASVIPGANSNKQVLQNIAAFLQPIPREFWSELRECKLIRSDAPIP
jgi:D-threo-aldose 1-dehydrogenase